LNIKYLIFSTKMPSELFSSCDQEPNMNEFPSEDQQIALTKSVNFDLVSIFFGLL